MNFPLQNIGLQPPTTTFKHLNVVLLQGLRGAIDGILLHILGHVRVFDHGLCGREKWLRGGWVRFIDVTDIEVQVDAISFYMFCIG